MTAASSATDSPTSREPFVPRPTLVSGVLGVLVGVLVLWLLVDTTIQRRLLVATVVFAVSIVLGARAWDRDRSLVGAGVALCGLLLAVVTLGYAASEPAPLVHRVKLVPGLLGILAIVAALLPVRYEWSRRLVDVGTGLLFVAVLTAGIVRGASATALVVAAAATILAWDAAENAVSMGGQIGSGSGTVTRRAELVHVGLTGTVAGGAVATVLVVDSLGIDGLPFAALVALLVAGVALLLAYHR